MRSAQTAAFNASFRSGAERRHLFALLNITLSPTPPSLFSTQNTPTTSGGPVTAIQMANIDNNPQTDQDPTWILPCRPRQAPDPSFPGAHSATSFAAAEVLRLSLGDQIILDVTSGVPGAA